MAIDLLTPSIFSIMLVNHRPAPYIELSRCSLCLLTARPCALVMIWETHMSCFHPPNMLWDVCTVSLQVFLEIALRAEIIPGSSLIFLSWSRACPLCTAWNCAVLAKVEGARSPPWSPVGSRVLGMDFKLDTYWYGVTTPVELYPRRHTVLEWHILDNRFQAYGQQKTCCITTHIDVIWNHSLDRRFCKNFLRNRWGS